ncbi:MAG: tRNA (adenosine(37)-N6)-threonylcarbamoyltransferase complex dimerization subunit type 1 TsaB [Pyrinomonadaceae bacterium]
MTSDADERLVLAIESAVAGGSISLLRGTADVDSISGGPGASRAEELLPSIAAILERNGIDKRDLDLLAVSVGPGSYTGIRIGISTALGLKKALGINCAGVSVLEAMAQNYGSAGRLVTAVPVGKRDICLQQFEYGETAIPVGGPRMVSEDVFSDLISLANDAQKIIYSELIERLGISAGAGVISTGPNLAYPVGLLALTKDRTDRIEPIFAPARER